MRGLSASAGCSNSGASIPVRLLAELAQQRQGGGGGGGGSGGTGGATGAPALLVKACWMQQDGKLAAKVEASSEMAEQLMSSRDRLHLIPGIRISSWAPGGGGGGRQQQQQQQQQQQLR